MAGLFHKAIPTGSAQNSVYVCESTVMIEVKPGETCGPTEWPTPYRGMFTLTRGIFWPFCYGISAFTRTLPPIRTKKPSAPSLQTLSSSRSPTIVNNVSGPYRCAG